MKTAAFVFALLTVLLAVQPLAGRVVETRTETAAKSCCNRSKKCHAKTQDSEDKDCATRGCSYFAGCPACQYLPVEKTNYRYLALVAEKHFNPHYTEHIAQGFSSSCWQPPEPFFV